MNNLEEIDSRILQIIVCPVCRGDLTYLSPNQVLQCKTCPKDYSFVNRTSILLIEEEKYQTIVENRDQKGLRAYQKNRWVQYIKPPSRTFSRISPEKIIKKYRLLDTRNLVINLDSGEWRLLPGTLAG